MLQFRSIILRPIFFVLVMVFSSPVLSNTQLSTLSAMVNQVASGMPELDPNKKLNSESKYKITEDSFGYRFKANSYNLNAAFTDSSNSWLMLTTTKPLKGREFLPVSDLPKLDGVKASVAGLLRDYNARVASSGAIKLVHKRFFPTYIMEGYLFSIDGGRPINVSQTLFSAVMGKTVDRFKQLKKDKALVTLATDDFVKNLWVFFDPTCFYCKKFYKDIPELNRKGWAVNLIPYDRKPDDFGDGVFHESQYLCADDGELKRLYDRFNQGEEVSLNMAGLSSKSKFGLTNECYDSSLMARNKRNLQTLYETFTIPGTPKVIIGETFESVDGYVPAENWPDLKSKK